MSQGKQLTRFREIGGISTGNYNEAVMAAGRAATGVSQGFHGSMIGLLKYLTSSSNNSLPGLQAEYANIVGASNWDGVSVFPEISNCKLWCRYNKGITVTGSGVSQWDDQSGNGNHLLQGTDANRPALQSDGSILFDGITNYLRSNTFTLAQPETVYILAKQISWSAFNRIIDGYTNNLLTIQQRETTPGIKLNVSGTLTNQNNDFVIGAYAVVSSVFNGANSLIQINKNTATTGTVGAGDGGGITIGAAPSEAAWSNIQVKEVIVFSAAHDATQRAAMIDYLAAVGRLTV